MYLEKFYNNKKILKKILTDVFRILNESDDKIAKYLKYGNLHIDKNAINFDFDTDFETHIIYISDFMVRSTYGPYDIDEKLDKYWYNLMSRYFEDYEQEYYNHYKQKIDDEHKRKIEKLNSKIESYKTGEIIKD